MDGEGEGSLSESTGREDGKDDGRWMEVVRFLEKQVTANTIAIAISGSDT